VGGLYYEAIGGAYGDPLTGTGALLEVQGVSFAEDLVLNRDIDVTLAGGRNCEYTASAMGTGLVGSLTVSRGTVSVEHFVIQ
jgi:hypothetical protein